MLVLHDTTEFSFQREDPLSIGATHKVNSGKDQAGRLRMHTVCGLLMHSSLVVTTEGLPLGIAAVKFWTRKKFKGCNALKKKINPTRVPIEEKESVRWLENLKQATALLNESERCVHTRMNIDDERRQKVSMWSSKWKYGVRASFQNPGRAEGSQWDHLGKSIVRGGPDWRQAGVYSQPTAGQ